MFATKEDYNQLFELMGKVMKQDPPSRPMESFLLEAQTEEKRYIQRLMFDTAVDIAKAIVSGDHILPTEDAISKYAWEATTKLAIKSGICIDGEKEGEGE